MAVVVLARDSSSFRALKSSRAAAVCAAVGVATAAGVGRGVFAAGAAGAAGDVVVAGQLPELSEVVNRTAGLEWHAATLTGGLW